MRWELKSEVGSPAPRLEIWELTKTNKRASPSKLLNTFLRIDQQSIWSLPSRIDFKLLRSFSL
jgi:hypothetical protein